MSHTASIPRARRTVRPRGFVTSWRQQDKTRERLAQVDEVLRAYVEHLPLTIRQIFYVLVGVHGHPKTEKAYKNLCELLAMARRAHVIDMAHIRDDDAPVPGYIGFEDVVEFLETVRDQASRLHIDRQTLTRPGPYVAVLCEAKGMVPQLQRVAGGFSVPVLGSGGFDSITYKHAFARWAASIRRPVEVLHVGDHDPSGVHLFSSFAEDVQAFAARYLGDVRFSRLVVNAEQAIAWGLPTKPKKGTDRRSFDGIGSDREATVQCEAVPPDRLAALLRAALVARIPEYVVAAAEMREVDARRFADRGLTRLLPPSAR